jgi:hypothetical protein
LTEQTEHAILYLIDNGRRKNGTEPRHQAAPANKERT